MPTSRNVLPTLELLDANAAGIDVGSETLHVSIAGDAPQVFGTVTSQLQALRAYLLEHEVRTVALEATGVYWMCLYEELTTAGLQVLVVNGRHVKNLPGRKTDVSDCQWLATLHAHGLLRGGFVPTAQVRCLQDYLRLRQDHITLAASHVQHMQKALERMNLKPHDVIRSLTGASGLKMMRAIVAGERDPQRLLELCDVQIRKKKGERLREALRGTWKEEHLFALRQALAGWEFYQRQIVECDQAIELVLHEMNATLPDDHCDHDDHSDSGDDDPAPLQSCAPAVPTETAGATATPSVSQSSKAGGTNTPQIAGLHDLLVRLCGGHDATAIPGVADYSLLQLVGEVGTDLTRWRTEKHFTSWLGLTPGSKQSGKRRSATKKERNRAGRLFCVLARSLAASVDKALGGFYRRLRARRGGLVANQALARKLAEMFWRVMVHGVAYVESGLAIYEARVAQTEQHALRRLAAKHGFTLHPSPSPHPQVVG